MAINNNLTNEKNDLMTSNAALIKEKDNLNIEIEKLKITNESLIVEKDKLDESVKKYKDIINIIHTKLNILGDITGDEEQYKSELVKALEEFEKRLYDKEMMCKLNDKKIDENNKKNSELEASIVELKAKINEQEIAIEKLNAKILAQDTMITSLSIEKNDALSKVEQSKAENIKSLEELKQKNYTEFKLKLTELFNAIYPETIANVIIEQMDMGERT